MSCGNNFNNQGKVWPVNKSPQDDVDKEEEEGEDEKEERREHE
jgi:hypothetical protein